MELEIDQLRRQTPEAEFGFETTAELEPLTGTLGQGRAEHALEFAMGMRFEGYNLFALGVTRTGMHGIIREHLESLASGQDVPDDTLYVNNFADPSNPRVIRLPHGVGQRVKTDFASFIADVRSTLPNAFNTDEYRQQAAQLSSSFQERQMADAAELQKQAESRGLTMLPTPNGFAFAPVKDNKVMSQEDFAALDEATRKSAAQAIDEMNQVLIERLGDYPRFQEQFVIQQRTLVRETAKRVLSGLTSHLSARYQIYPPVLAQVAAIEEDLLGNAEKIIAFEKAASTGISVPSADADRFFQQYQANLVVDNGQIVGAPVVYESNPSLDNLLGKLEHHIEMGMPVTDFSMIRPGALHRANGGYLMLDAERLLQKPFAWEALKRALSDRTLRMESVSQMLNLTYTVSLDPEPVPLDVKVVLMGDRQLYHLLRRYDSDFDSQFKIVADFEDVIEWTPDNQADYVRLVARLVTSTGIRHLSAAGVAALLGQSSRLVEDRRRLSAHIEAIRDILIEADSIAAESEAETISASDIEQVITRRAYRIDRIREAVHEDIIRGFTVVKTDGAKTGQINGLSMIQIGKLVFGQPSRITATARLGRGEVIDIEREARLGGNIHTKAVMIVSNFIGSRYAKLQPLSLHASLVFEQSYGGIEGDSASIAEVCALISAITDRPIRQDLAVTGSMDQHGTVQAIGGVNQKIEGFFEICRMQGISGTQGVIVPSSNIDNLMLGEDVVQAVGAGQFHVYTMDTVDDAMTLLFAEPGGAPAEVSVIDGEVRAKLADLHRIWRQSNTSHRDDGRRKDSEENPQTEMGLDDHAK